MTGRPEPILKWGSIVALVKILLALAVGRGVPLLPEEVELIVQAITLLEPFSVWWLARRHTTPYVPPTDPQE